LGKKAPDTKRNIMERVADYFSFFLEAIKENMWVRNEEISFREIAEIEGYIRGRFIYMVATNSMFLNILSLSKANR
jgi:hypothetical protein